MQKKKLKMYLDLNSTCESLKRKGMECYMGLFHFLHNNASLHSAIGAKEPPEKFGYKKPDCSL